jgi:hypothetical protein
MLKAAKKLILGNQLIEFIESQSKIRWLFVRGSGTINWFAKIDFWPFLTSLQ